MILMNKRGSLFYRHTRLQREIVHDIKGIKENDKHVLLYHPPPTNVADFELHLLNYLVYLFGEYISACVYRQSQALVSHGLKEELKDESYRLL